MLFTLFVRYEYFFVSTIAWILYITLILKSNSETVSLYFHVFAIPVVGLYNLYYSVLSDITVQKVVGVLVVDIFRSEMKSKNGQVLSIQ